MLQNVKRSHGIEAVGGIIFQGRKPVPHRERGFGLVSGGLDQPVRKVDPE